jgi:hypothetical protein
MLNSKRNPERSVATKVKSRYWCRNHKPKTKNYKLAIFAAMTEKILILDFGSHYTQLIARAVR